MFNLSIVVFFSLVTWFRMSNVILCARSRRDVNFECVVLYNKNCVVVVCFVTILILLRSSGGVADRGPVDG